MSIRWYGDLLWLFVPVQQKIKDFFADFEQYPYQAGSGRNAAGVNYNTLRDSETLKRLQQLENFTPPCPELSAERRADNRRGCPTGCPEQPHLTDHRHARFFRNILI